MEAINHQDATNEPGLVGPLERVEPEKHRAWEMIEEGRYQPRRIRGSCLGRELG